MDAKKEMESITTKSWFKFGSNNDYVKGLAQMDEMLKSWQEKADEGFERKYSIVPNNEEFKFQLVLEVMPHGFDE